MLQYCFVTMLEAKRIGLINSNLEDDGMSPEEMQFEPLLIEGWGGL